MTTSPYLANPTRYDAMSYRRAGESGLQLPALSLGLWQNFGTERDLETQRSIVRRAFDLGITHFDLANNYGPPPGSAESNFGALLRSDLAPYRDELIISSKAGFDMWPGPYGDGGSRKYLISSLDQSLSRMGLDYVDIFYSHRYDPTVPLEETMAALASIYRQGKALYVGISNYGPEQTRRAYELLGQMGVRLLIHQPRYSMLDRVPEEGLLDEIGRLAIGCIVYSPLAQGLLTDRYLDGALPGASRAAGGGSLDGGAITDDYLRFARGLAEIAAERGQSIAQLALSWVLRDERVTSAIIGASSVAQLEQNVAALDGAPLDSDQQARIEGLLSERTGT
jgi:L-glyceraldehyde 3-phosphate reductase